ncbi:MAG TPA: hypothetical protein VMW75_00905 [Thermoanaerobaculia bacterium]|nr:hypothetical protein [Thermoanaerobaculia bacterium]
MKGPFDLGTLGTPLPPPSPGSWERNRLFRGRRYRVTKPFLDSDGDEHKMGEEWEFLGTLFSKFDDELTICVKRDDGREWAIPLVWKKGRQWQVLENWNYYFEPI